VIAQIVMVPVAALCGRMADKIGRKPLFIAGFLALLSRALLYAFITTPLGIIGIEAIDGVSTALGGVTAVLVISDLARNTGRFNLLQGAAQAALGVGAFAGKVGSGWLASVAGFRVAFLALAVVAAAGLLGFMLLIPETRETHT
jgi:MFS family permease